jgi:hypothetical protein
MQKIISARHFLPLIFIALFAVGLVACNGNNSSTNDGLLGLIDPIEVNKTINPVEWDSNNAVEMASNAYRAISKNTLLRAVFTNKLVPLDLSVDLFSSLEDRDCRISGRINFETANTECFDDRGNEVDCSAGNAFKIIDSQLSKAVACQDGYLSGQYIDGFLNISKLIDFTTEDETLTSRTISAIGTITTLDANGDPVLDVSGAAEVDEKIDYLFQNELVIFFFDNEYESYIDFSLAKLTCGANSYHRVEREGIRSDKIGTLEGDGTNSYYPYTEYTALKLESIPTESCDEEDGLVITYSYSLSATMANAAMGGGEDRNTQATWVNMDFSLAGQPSGVLFLTHENGGGNYELKLEFNEEGDQVMITILSPNSSNGSIILSLAEFLALSQPARASR